MLLDSDKNYDLLLSGCKQDKLSHTDVAAVDAFAAVGERFEYCPFTPRHCSSLIIYDMQCLPRSIIANHSSSCVEKTTTK